MTLNAQKLEDLHGRLFGEISAGYGGVMVALGEKLGLYKAMSGAGSLTAAEVARRSSCGARYIQEWLNSQVAGGYVDYDADTGTYALSPEQATMLADETSPYYLPYGWQVVASMWADEAKSLKAIRSAKGMSWGEHDGRLFCGVAGIFRNGYSAFLVDQWLPALKGVTSKLEKGATVADVGCGHGHSTVLMAQAFPNSRFWGFDTHEGSIEVAREVARKAGVERRVTFAAARADDYPRASYDLICLFDCLHDMGRPVDAAQFALSAMAKDGTMMVVEPFARNRVEENINPVGRLYYAASTTMCCAHAISESGTHVLGAQAGPERLEAVLKAGGFGTIRAAAQTPFNIVLEAIR